MSYFLQVDIDDLNERIDKIMEQVQAAGQDMGISCRQSAETYHDNAPYEEAVRSFEFYTTRIRELIRIQREIRLILPPKTNKRVVVGTTVTVLDLVAQEQATFAIGSFLVFRPGRISYKSPLAKLLIGAGVGSIRKGVIADQERQFRVVKIEL